MGGGLLQLVAYGAQDAYISGNPQITFFKGLYKRHTNFAMEPFRVNFTGQAAWGTKQSAVIGRNADLMYSTYLEVVLEAGYYNNDQQRLGYNLLKYAELEIGGQLIDRQYGEFLYLWDALTMSDEKKQNLNMMVGGKAAAGPVGLGGEQNCNMGSGRPSLPGTILYIPLYFFYTRNPGAALPLIALQYHEVRINLLWNDSKFIAGDFTQQLYASPPQPIQAAIYIDYIYLDTEERRRMAQQSHEYLIEQTQFNEDKGMSSYSNRIDLTFNHPVKELIWVVQPTGYTNCNYTKKMYVVRETPASVVTVTGSGSGSGLQVFVTAYGVDFTTVTPDGSNRGSNYNVGDIITAVSGFGTVTFTVAAVAGGAVYAVSNISGNATPILYAGNNLQPFTYDNAAVYEQFLQINGQDRLEKRYGNYFNSVQQFQHHTGSGVTALTSPLQGSGNYPAVKSQPGIYSYSFALRPEEHQPSGTCNFSRIDTATIVMTLDGSLGVSSDNDETWDVRVYAINYNILRVMSGMGGLAYSN